MKTIDILTLDSVTGGAARRPTNIVSPCFSLMNKKLLEASADDIAQAKVSCNLKLPTRRQIRNARNRVF